MDSRGLPKTCRISRRHPKEVLLAYHITLAWKHCMFLLYLGWQNVMIFGKYWLFRKLFWLNEMFIGDQWTVICILLYILMLNSMFLTNVKYAWIQVKCDNYYNDIYKCFQVTKSNMNVYYAIVKYHIELFECSMPHFAHNDIILYYEILDKNMTEKQPLSFSNLLLWLCFTHESLMKCIWLNTCHV